MFYSALLHVLPLGSSKNRKLKVQVWNHTNFIEEKNTYRLEKFTRETQKVEKQKANSSFSRKSEVQKKRETSLKNQCAKKHTRDFRGKNSRILWVYLKDSILCQEASCFSKHQKVQN